MTTKKSKPFIHVLFLLLILALIFPVLQSRYQWFNIRPLYGGFVSEDKPSFSKLNPDSLPNKGYRERFSRAIEQHLGFRNFLIRMNNQINFSLYGITDNHNLVIGKDNCIFEEGYILACLGHNFIGKALIDERLRRTLWVQDYLKKEKNIDLLIVFEPGKGSYHSAYIPDRYIKQGRQMSNYDYYVQRCRETGIRHVDLNAWFLAMRDTASYPLIPRYGVHWGSYGMTLAADSLVRCIEKIRNADLPDFEYGQLQVTDQKKDVDFDWDAEQTLNLMFRLPFDTMAYPELKLIADSSKFRPRVLTIADSYYWNFYNSGIPQHCFRDHQFWYYYFQVYPHIWDYSHLVSSLPVKEEIEKQDVILVMITEMNLYRAFWQFTDDLYKWYCPDYREDPLYDRMNQSCGQDHWLRDHIRLARRYGISTEEALYTHALMMR